MLESVPEKCVFINHVPRLRLKVNLVTQPESRSFIKAIYLSVTHSMVASWVPSLLQNRLHNFFVLWHARRWESTTPIHQKLHATPLLFLTAPGRILSFCLRLTEITQISLLSGSINTLLDACVSVLRCLFTPLGVRSASDRGLETDIWPLEMEWKGLIRLALDTRASVSQRQNQSDRPQTSDSSNQSNCFSWIT